VGDGATSRDYFERHDEEATDIVRSAIFGFVVFTLAIFSPMVQKYLDPMADPRP
jgi:hypothetical protein